MEKYKPFLRKNLFFLLVLTLIGIVYLGSSVRSSSFQPSKGTVKINNLTHSCEILNAEKHREHIKVSFRNNGDQAITAYVFSNIEPEMTYTVTEEFAFSETDAVIGPGQIYDRIISISDRLDRRSEIVFNLSAIMLEDNTGEGDPKVIRDIKDYRLGEKIQLMKALPVMDNLLRLSEAEINAYWDKAAKHDFEAALNTPDIDWLTQLRKQPLSRTKMDGESPFASGAQAGKEYVLQKIQEVKDSVKLYKTVGPREDIIRLRNMYAKMIARL